VGKMYPRRKNKDIFMDVDDLDLYNEEIIRQKVEEGVLNPEEAGFLRGAMEAYEEEEEED